MCVFEVAGTADSGSFFEFADHRIERFQVLQGVLEEWSPVLKRWRESPSANTLTEQMGVTISVEDFTSAVTRSFRDSLNSGMLVPDSPNDLWELARIGK